MEKCVRPSCNRPVGENKVEVEGKVYCSQECVDHCTDEVCTLEDGCCSTK